MIAGASESFGKEDRPIIEFLMSHGCRPGEARALRVKDVDLQTETMTISSTFSGDTLRDRRKGRHSKAVTLPIQSECIEFMMNSCRGALPGAFVFPNPRTGRPSTQCVLNRVGGRVRATAEISSDLRLYDATRHSLATQLRLTDVPLQDIKDKLGHSDIRTTMRYSDDDVRKLRANLDKLSVRKVIHSSGGAEWQG
jgi:integrase